VPWELPDAARERIELSLAMIEALDRQLAPIEQGLRQLARRQTGCRALMAHYGIGELTAPTILCEFGDVSRLSASRKAVRCAGLDIGVHRSDRRSRTGKLTRQGSPQLGALRVSPSGVPGQRAPDPAARMDVAAGSARRRLPAARPARSRLRCASPGRHWRATIATTATPPIARARATPRSGLQKSAGLGLNGGRR
jgi:transposase